MYVYVRYIPSMGSANGRRRYLVTPPVIDWVLTQNDPWRYIRILFSLYLRGGPMKI